MKKKLFMLLAVVAVIATLALPGTYVQAASKKKSTKKTTTTEVAKEPVTMYVLYAGYCGYCQALHTYLDETLTQDPDYKDKFKIVYIEIADEDGNSISGNNEMYSTIADHFEYTGGAIPFYVVGDQYMTGYSEDLQADIKSMIDEEYKDKKYKDVVSTLIDVNSVVYPESSSSEESESTKNNNMIGYIVLGITAVIIIAIIFGRSKTSYYEEEK